MLTHLGSHGFFADSAPVLGLMTVSGASWSGGLVDLFPEDWEPARVALCCHLSLRPFRVKKCKRLGSCGVAAFVAHCCSVVKVSPILEGLHSMEWDVMGEQRVVSFYLSSSPLLLERAICPCGQRERAVDVEPSLLVKHW